MEDIKKAMIEKSNMLIAELQKPSKAAAQRARKLTLELTVLGKEFRRLSIEAEKAK